MNITTVGVEIAHLGKIFNGSLTDLDNLMFENGYRELMTVEIDKFYVKKGSEKAERKTKKKIKSEL